MAVSVEGFVILDIADTQYTLSGKFSGGKVGGIVVAYHRPFEESLNIGTIDNVVEGVGTALVGPDGAAGFKANWATAKENLKTVPVLRPALTPVITDAKIRITDLAINTLVGEYQFGFALDFTAAPLVVGPLTFEAFGVKLTYQKAAGLVA